MLAQQKLEYTDFSAGISENTVPGKPNAYARADNLLITRDKHLETRPGSKALSDTLYVLPSQYQRVGSFVNFYNDTALLAQSGTDFCYQSGSPAAWVSINGPTGGKPFAHNTAYSRVFSAQWRQHVYLVTDSGDSPQMFYYDNTGAPQFRTAGLPRPTLTPLYSAASGLTAAITLAVALQTSMVMHLGDTVSHLTADSGGISIQALATPTSLASLISFIRVLKTYYNLHIADAQLSTTSQVFHIQKNSVLSGAISQGRYAVLNVLASTALVSPTDLPSAIATLNDLRNRFNLHTYATITHADAVSSLSVGGTYATNSTGYGKNACPLPPVNLNATTTAALTVYNPTVSGQLSTLLAYINQIKTEFNAHLSSAFSGSNLLGYSGDHNNPDTDNLIVVPNATDYLSALVLLAHLEFFYWWHFQDASFGEQGIQQSFTTFTGTYSNGSASITSTSIDGSLYVGQYFQNLVSGSPWTGWSPTFGYALPYAKVASGTASTVVASQNSTRLGSVASSFRITTSKYHWGLDPANGSLTTPSLYNTRVTSYDYSLTNLFQLQSAAFFLLGLIKSHQLGGLTAYTNSAGNTAYHDLGTPTSTVFQLHYTGTLNSINWPEAAIPDVANPGFPLSPTPAQTYLNTPPVVSSVLYTFVWRYNYTAGGLSFENDSSPSLLSQVYGFPSPQNPLPLRTAQYPVSLGNLPVLTNAVGQNWDTSNIQLDVYRTISGGTTFFKVGSVPNGVTSFVDNVTDNSLVSNQRLYTTGGVLQNDQPPASQFITIMNNTAYYGYCTDITSGQVFPNRILQSIPFAPYAVPAANFDDLDDALAGLSNFNNYVIAFCRTRIYRMEGQFDQLGNGLLTHQQVAPTIGAIGQAGIVQTEYGIFFCGTNGIYWTDGFQLKRVTGELEATYNALIQTPLQRQRVNGVYDKATRRIYWTFCSTPTAPECDVGYVLDLNWGLSESMSFTTISGGATFSPTAWVVFNSQLIRGTSYGFIFKHDAQYTSDQTPRLGVASTPSLWAPQAIIYNFESCATNFGTSQIRKWATRLTYQGQVKSNLYLQMSRKNDNGAGWKQLVPVRSVTAMQWGDPAIKWNDTPVCRWGADGMIDTFRRMPSGSLRCDWMAVQFTNASAIICSSDTYGLGTIGTLSSTIKIVVLSTTYKFPLWSTLYTISFDFDGYVEQHTIISGNAFFFITVADPNQVLVNGTTPKWQIRGIPYGQRFNLTAYNITWAPLADEQAAYHGPTSTDGGANT